MNRAKIAVSVIGVMVCAAAPAFAFTRQYPPSLCVGVTGFPVSIDQNGQASNPAGSQSTWLCPVIRDTTNPFTSGSPNVHVRGWSQGTNTIIATSCRASATGGTIVCGVGHGSGAAGLANVTWAYGSEWTGSASIDDSFYVQMAITGSNVTIFGYSASM